MSDFTSYRQFDAVIARWGMDVWRRTDRAILVRCPFDDSQRAHLYLYPNGHSKCYVCGRFYTAPKFLYMALAFTPDQKDFTREEWREWDEFAAREQIGEPASPTRVPRPAPVTPPPFADQARWTAFFRWGQRYLDDPIAYQYWHEARGLGQHARRFLSYAPPHVPWPDEFADFTAAHAWRGKLMLGVMEATRPHLLAYAQARTIPPNLGVKYLSPPGWVGMPTLIPAARQPLHIVEGLVKAIPLNALDASVCVLWGTGRIRAAIPLLRDARRPLIFWRDHDEAGEIAAFLAQSLLREANIPLRVVTTPAAYPDVDTFALYEPDNFRAMVMTIEHEVQDHAHQEIKYSYVF